MKNFLLLILFVAMASFATGQTTVYLGIGINSDGTFNGNTAGGCDASCEGTTFMVNNPNSVVCTGTGSGNAAGTATASLTVPAGFYLDLAINTVECNTSTHGLDGGDDLFVNGEQIVDGTANTPVNYAECFQNPTSSDLTIDIAFNVNRRDEVVEVVYNIVAADPGTGGADGCNTTAITPVELSTFTAVLEKDQVVLNWATETELDNSYFSLEKSVDGIYFAELAEIKGAGTTVEAQSYSFVDVKLFSGLNYYRLKQVDFDGTYEYSEIVIVDTDTKTDDTKVYPVPTSDVLTITTTREMNALRVIDITGKVVMVEQFDTTNQQELNVSRLVAGTYFVAIQAERGLEMLRFVKK